MSTPPKKETSFVTKVIIVTVAIGALISLVTPNTDALTRFDTPANRLFLLSFIQNPEALYMVSEIRESENRLDLATREMRLAIGLLEMNNADTLVIKKYKERLEQLKAKK